jgi:hypothetical protein
MTARPRGAFCSPPSPRPSDIGSIPKIIAVAVISTGRIRAWPAASIASRGDISVISRSSLANVTIRIMLAVPTPNAHDRAHQRGTLRAVPVRKSIQSMPAIAPGSAARMISGSTQD